MCTWFMQLRTPPDFMDEYILHSLSTVAARSSAGCYCRSCHADIWTRRMLLQIQTCIHMKLRAHMTNTAKLSIVCSDSWHHRDYSFTRSQAHDGLWCACKMNVWTPRSDTWQVRNRKNVKISVNRWELKFPKDWDISQSLGNQNSQRLGIFKLTASWQFNFGKYPKNNREKPRPRPA